VTGAVDAHHHFWDPRASDYPWMTDAMATIRRPFGPDDLRPLIADAGITRTVVVQTQSSLDETREFLRTAASEPFVAGVVGWVDLTAPSVADDIAALRAGPGGDRLVGIRHQVHDEPDADWLSRADVRRGLGYVAAAGLGYDLLLRPRELPAALDTVRALPELAFVIDHLAKPSIAAGERQPWADRLAAMAALPNVCCKLSGFVTEADWSSWTVDDLRPYVAHVLDVFGPSRILFGSDWPVCLLAATYDRVIATVHELIVELSPTERSQILGGNAATFYRLAPVAPTAVTPAAFQPVELPAAGLPSAGLPPG
jgi:L-fuconolactonase